MTFMRVGWLLVLMGCLTACGKKEPATSEPPPVRKVSVADEPAPSASSAPAPTTETPAEAPPPGPQLALPASPELAKIIIAVQKHALTTGRFPTGWNEVIAAKVVDEIPKGKDGRPMTWKEFERAIAPE